LDWISAELALTALAAMFSPTTLTFCVLVLVLGKRPLRTGLWFYFGALGATLGIGIVAAFVIGNVAASQTPSTPKTWVAVVDVIAALALLFFVLRAMRRPPNPERAAGMIAQMEKVSSSRAVAILGAGAALANPGAFIPIALKDISELDPSTTQYIVDWVFFSLASLFPLLVALVLLVVAREWTERALGGVRAWLELHARTVAAAIVVLLALSLLRNGIAGLTG
jgi:hypothetical protein